MAGVVSNVTRNRIASAFRERICDTMGITPFVHQRKWWCAADGLVLLEEQQDQHGVSVRLPDDTTDRWAVAERPSGHARFLADLGSFKIGKSFGAALWVAGFGAVPGCKIHLIGSEYDICEPEFSYICDFLLSERGMNMPYKSIQNRPRDGKMWLDLDNGVKYEARSWERKDSLKGKEVDCYLYCEAYQLPGIECFTDFSQNLRVREGFAIFATTPDRPWVQLLHELGHGADPEWHCTCDIPADVNPYAFDAKAKERDRGLMTREKFAIHYEGKLGSYVGRVFAYQRGEREFGPGTHPELFHNGRLRVPDGWTVVGGADTGTYYSAVVVAFSPEGEAFVLDEFPNYDYIGQRPERNEDLTIPQWASTVVHETFALGGRPHFKADANSQFKQELKAYGLTLLPSKVPVETRTEITREYFQHGKIWLSPSLRVLPFELENAQWPEEATASGKYARIKDRDHTLDCLEHILATRPRGRVVGARPAGSTWAEQTFGMKRVRRYDPHVGRT